MGLHPLQMGLGSIIGILLVIIILIIFRYSIRTIKEYERAIVFRLGRLTGEKESCSNALTVTISWRIWEGR